MRNNSIIIIHTEILGNTLSPLHNKNALKLAIENSSSIKGVLDYLGLSASGHGYRSIRKWTEIHGLVLPEYYPSVRQARTLDEILTKGSKTTSSSLLVKLVAVGLKQNKCEICGQGNTWMGKPLTLHLDHIDGDHDNNLLENLRILCPHCHQQTPTFGAKNMKSKPKRKYFCECGQERTKDAIYCFDCSPRNPRNKREKKLNIATSRAASIRKTGPKPSMARIQPTKINWPPIEEILSLLDHASFVEVGRVLGVSDNSIRKHLRRSGVQVPKKYKPRN